MNRDNLIDIISRCNSTEIKKQWILDMANNSDIECSESQCDGCKIRTDCLSVLQPESIISYPTPECQECGRGADAYECPNCEILKEYVK